MNRKTRKPQAKAIVKGATTNSPSPAGFDEVLALIEATRSRVVTAVNTALIDLYWRIGQYISRKIAEEGWGQGTVAALAEYIIIPHLVVCLREPPSRPRPLRSSAITQNPYSAGSLRTGMQPLLQ